MKVVWNLLVVACLMAAAGFAGYLLGHRAPAPEAAEESDESIQAVPVGPHGTHSTDAHRTQNNRLWRRHRPERRRGDPLPSL